MERIIHGTRSYGISLRLFKLVAREWEQWDVESNTRTDIPYLQATMYYFVYYINTIALYRKVKPIILKTKNRGINNSRMKITQWVGAKAQDGKMLWIMITKLSFIEFVLTDRRKISDKRKNWPMINLPVVDFRSHPQEMLLSKPLNT